MAKTVSLLAATSTLLVGSTLAANCTTEVTTAALAVATNATYLNTCAKGSTWKLTTLFEATNLSASDFLTFCNATECMHPMHELIDEIPEGCTADVNGKSVVLAEAIGDVHNKCHEALHKAQGSHHEDADAGDDHDDDDHDHDAKNGSSHANSSANSSTPTPAPSKSAAMTLAAVSVASAASVVAALVL